MGTKGKLVRLPLTLVCPVDSFTPDPLHMRIFSTVSCLFLAMVVHAQFTIGEADMPSAGDTMRFRSGDGSGIALELTGADHLWDFGDLTPQGEVADTAVTVGATPFLYQFFFNNIFLFPDHVADYAMKGANFGFGQFSLSDVYDYYRADPDGFRNVGFGANVNGLPTSVRRDPIDVIHRFPMNFGDEDSSASAYNVTVPTVLYFGQDQLRHNIVDGWGTLYLPADTFQVLRVKSVLERTDTIYVDQFQFGFRLPEPETVEYKWIAQGMDAPVLQVTTLAGVPVSTRFFYEPEDVTTAVPVQASSGTPALYPNPSSSEVYVHLPGDLGGTITVIDATGREVSHASNVAKGALHRIDLGGLPVGSYTVRLLGAARPWSSSFIVR